MASQVADPQVATSLDTISAGLEALLGSALEPVDARDAITTVAELECLRRKLDAAQLDVMDAIDRRGLHRSDGHGSVKIMVRHVAKLSGGEAAGRDKAMRVLRDLPEVRASYRAAEVGCDQVRLLGRVHANGRVRAFMPEQQGWFLDKARRLSFRNFELEVRQWERLVDDDGPEPNDRAHQNRDAKLIQNHLTLGWELAGWFAAMQGASMREVYDHYIDAELLADWEKAKAEHGDAATAADLPRTDAQRRADALWQIFQDAANATGSPVPTQFVHNIEWSADAYEEMLARLDGATPQPLDPDTFRCETIDGYPLEPIEAAANSLVTKVRRVVTGAKSETIDQGQARRFTGAARTAVQHASTTCVWPGCYAATSRCEIDHLHEHGKGGRTCPDNGAPLCGKHNRWKQKGFTVGRDPTGDWHTYRPDGSEIE